MIRRPPRSRRTDTLFPYTTLVRSAPVAPTTAVTSTKTKKEREQLLADIQAALAPYGVRTEITPYSNRHFLADFITPQIRANIDLDADDAEPSMIHWYRATANPKAVPEIGTASCRERVCQYV